jgi:hypothetical protein
LHGKRDLGRGHDPRLGANCPRKEARTLIGPADLTTAREVGGFIAVAFLAALFGGLGLGWGLRLSGILNVFRRRL